jgi:uncharacterized lipoprotein YddW (UPF0748 family)
MHNQQRYWGACVMALCAACISVAGCEREEQASSEAAGEVIAESAQVGGVGAPLPASTWREVAAGETPALPQRELRAAWVATVANIDWPSKRGLSAAQQRAEALVLIDAADKAGLNALVFQVRPACDAMYASEIEPWSEFLTGESGTAPDEAYDPLEFWVKECHARGIELHAWFNPFRARHFDSKKPDAPTHISNTRPDLVYEYDRYKWLDPGSPEAQDYSMRVMLDVVRRYDIDGIHIDDYFYPYPKAGEDFPDAAVYERAMEGVRARGGQVPTKADWRRANINTFVERMYRETKALKPHVRVGISPFGIWRPGNPAGVEGFDAYERLYADARLWLREGWMDYAAPQLYWKVSAPKQPFAPLLDWWIGESVRGVPVYPGLYTSRLDPAGPSKWMPVDITEQIEIARTREGAGGQIHFSMKAISLNYVGIAPALAEGVYAHGAIVPVCTTCPAPALPLTSAAVMSTANGPLLTWRDPGAASRTALVGWHKEGRWHVQRVGASAERVQFSAEGGAPERVALALLGRDGVAGEWRVWAAPGGAE